MSTGESIKRIPRRAGETEIKKRGDFPAYQERKLVLCNEKTIHGAEQTALIEFLGEGWEPEQPKEAVKLGPSCLLGEGDASRFDVGTFDDKHGSHDEAMNWIAKNIGVTDVKQLTEYPPSREALVFLNMVNAGALPEKDFFTAWTRFKGNGKGNAQEDQSSSRTILDLIANIEETSSSTIHSFSPERSSKELDIPPPID